MPTRCAHFCPDWDGMQICEHDPEIECCTCCEARLCKCGVMSYYMERELICATARCRLCDRRAISIIGAMWRSTRPIWRSVRQWFRWGPKISRPQVVSPQVAMRMDDLIKRINHIEYAIWEAQLRDVEDRMKQTTGITDAMRGEAPWAT